MSKILAFGATGPIAGLVVPELARRNAQVRAFVRRAEQGELARERGASEIAIGDLNDADSVRDALSGVTSVFYIAPVFLRNQAEIGQRLVAQAVDAGVKRFVFSSVIHPVLSALPNHTFKAPVEEAVLNTSLEFTFLHPAIVFQNYAGTWRDIVDKRQIAEPWSNETRHSRVDYRDVAEVAAMALTDDRLMNGTFELCANGDFNRREIAAMVGEILGCEITPKRVDPDALGPDADALRPMFAHYDRHRLRGNALTLQAILGGEPRTLRAYFQELARSDSGSLDRDST